MIKQEYILYCGLMLFAAACNLSPAPIDVDIDEPPQKLVVSSYLIPPQEMALTLTRTFSALVSDSIDLNDSTNVDFTNLIFVDSALVEVEYAGERRTLEKFSPAIYGSFDVEHRFGVNYKLKAHDFKTGESIEAETTLLPQVSIDSLWPVSTILTAIGDTVYSFRIRFRDVPGDRNYYLLTYVRLSDFQNGFSNLGQSVFNNNSRNQFSVLADGEYGDGNVIEFSPSNTFSDWAQNDTMIVGLSNITRGYYDFLTAYKRSGNLLSQVTGEPINLPTNVKNGYGYFAMIRPKLGIIVLE